MAKKVLILNGSPRKKGNSASLAAELAKGAKAGGAEVESLFLHGMDIKPCTACDSCRKKPAKGCIIEDDMQEVYPRLRAANAIVVASPIYWFTFSAQTKLCMDRWYALGGGEGYALAGKRFGLVLAYADADPFLSGAVNAMRAFQDACRYLEADIIGMVYGSASKAGEIRRNKVLMEEAFELGRKIAAG